MKVKPDDGPPDVDRPPWRDHVSRLVARRRVAAALRALDRVVEHELPLFWGTSYAERSRRNAWLYRIQLLRELNRPAEALAWACLECELHPDSKAKLLREQLKQELGLGKIPSKEPFERVSWSGVAGMRDLKAELERDVVRPLKDPELHRQYGLSLPNGVIFYGPSGCGKTYLARSLGQAVGYRFTEVKPSDLANIYVHGTQQLTAKLFKNAREEGPSVLFFDEIDALIPKRTNASSHHHNEVVNEFLVQLDRCGDSGVLVVAATNLLDRIDTAALRPGRLEHHFYIGPPDFEGRFQGFKHYMVKRLQENGIDFLNLASVSDGLSFADIEFVVNQAAKLALETRVPISTDHLLHAVKRMKKHRVDS